jgi:hypothetical protein
MSCKKIQMEICLQIENLNDKKKKKKKEEILNHALAFPSLKFLSQ